MKKLPFLLIALINSVQLLAYDIAVKNADGITIYYNYINDAKELEVTSNVGKDYSGNVNIPETVTYMNRTRRVTSIGNMVFRGCSSLTSVTIPNSVTIIGSYAFAECFSLIDIIIPNSVVTIDNWAFAYCLSLTDVKISNSIATISGGVFLECSSLTTISIPNGVTEIGNFAFQNCASLTAISIPKSVTNIGNQVFSGCSSLTSVTIPDGVRYIGNGAFAGCTGLTSITIPSNVTTIYSSTFAGCTSLNDIIIPNKVKIVESWAFYGCTGLTSITVPNSVTHIGVKAFAECDITYITSFLEEPFPIEDDVFSKNTYYNATLKVPDGSVEKYKSTGGWNNFIYIENGAVSPDNPNKCSTPTIWYTNGKLKFCCDTEGAICQSTISDSDITSYCANEVQLGVTYNISVYATKKGYENSEVATATLCWIDQLPEMEGVADDEDKVTEVRATPILIQSEDGTINVKGAVEGTKVSVYEVNGKLVGSADSYNGHANIRTNLQSGSTAIVKIADRSIKVLIK